MNSLEKQMLALLVETEKCCAARYVKADFEAEGLRTEEILRLKNVAFRAGLKLSLTIGGCEAKRDLFESKNFGADIIVAPMVESAFALRKYEQAVHKVYSPEEREGIAFWFNLETKAATAKADEILASESACRLDIAAIDRVDLSLSLAAGEDDVDGPEVSALAASLARKVKASGLGTAIGGGVSSRSFGLVSKLTAEGILDYYETRKVGFSTVGISEERYRRGLVLAYGFEIFYLRDKLQGKRDSSARDAARLDFLETTYWDEIRASMPAIV
jgi:hypothetical protein